MINELTQLDIQKTLEEYLPKIVSSQPFPLALSNYRVEKNWGYEIWLSLSEFYAFKLIHMNSGSQCSLQSHEYKVEANYIIEGTADVLLEDDNGELQRYSFKAGEGWNVPVGRIHRVISTGENGYTALEVSSPNLNDVIRHQDDTGRGNGKIESEHRKDAKVIVTDQMLHG